MKADDLTPEDRYQLASDVFGRLKKGANAQIVVGSLVDAGWTEDDACSFVAEIEKHRRQMSGAGGGGFLAKTLMIGICLLAMIVTVGFIFVDLMHDVGKALGLQHNRQALPAASSDSPKVQPKEPTIEEIPTLIAGMRQPLQRIRRQSAAYLVKIGEPAVPALIELLRSQAEFLPGHERRVVDRYEKRHGKAPPAVGQAVKAELEKLRRTEVSMVLAKIGKPAVDPLIKMLEESNELLAARAAFALGRIGPPAADAVSALIKALENENADVRQLAALTLGEIGPDAKEALDMLKNLAAGDNSDTVRRACADAMKKIQSAP